MRKKTMTDPNVSTSGRVIGIRHRVKTTAAGEARPTQVTIVENGDVRTIELETEDNELDFVSGRHPASWRVATESDDLTKIPERHIKRRKKGEGEEVKVPDTFEGLKAGDVVVMMLGGSGGPFAEALHMRSLKIGADGVKRVPPKVFKSFAESETTPKRDKDQDALRLTDMWLAEPDAFYTFRQNDREIVQLIECLRMRKEAQKQRIACEQRLRQQAVGEAFRNFEEFADSNAAIEHAFDKLKANDAIFQAVVKEESRRDRELTKAAAACRVFTEILEPIEGVGPMTAARIIAGVQDIRRFIVTADPTKLRALEDEASELEAQAQADEVDPLVEEFAQASLAEAKATNNRYRQVQIYRSCLERMGGEEERVAMLTRAVKCRADHHRLKQYAVNKSVCKFRYYVGCGLREVVEKDGTKRFVFCKKRAGMVSNWHKDARQGLYLLGGDQFNKRANTPWGRRLRMNKASYRLKHPEEVKEGNIKKYTNGHIHNMAVWKTISEFAEMLFREWTKLEDKISAEALAADGDKSKAA